MGRPQCGQCRQCGYHVPADFAVNVPKMGSLVVLGTLVLHPGAWYCSPVTTPQKETNKYMYLYIGLYLGLYIKLSFDGGYPGVG